MKRAFIFGLLTLVTAGSLAHLSIVSKQTSANKAIAQSPPTRSTVQSRDVFYFSEPFGFRISQPKGYITTPSETKPRPNPTIPLQVLEIWKQADFLNREQLTETPPIIRLTVFTNSPKLPLTTWKGELSQKDDRPLKVAGQTAIAYTSTGLYESDNVLFRSLDDRYVFRFTVGYLSREDAIRQTFQDVLSSFTFDVLPRSNTSAPRQINYSRLQNLLAAGQWQAADIETRAIFQRLAGPQADLLFSSKSVISRIPTQELRTIDQLWAKASQGRFGFRAQQRIWQQIANSSKNPKIQADRFAQKVGWHRKQPLPPNHPLDLGLGGVWRFDTELTYTANAPVGHLPWMGVSASRLTDMLNERSLGCGSCTIDAMYLANDRYYDYLPAFFTKFK